MVRLSAMAREQRNKMFLYALLDVVLINISILIAICLWYGGTIPGLPGGQGRLIPSEVWSWYKYTFIFVSPFCLVVYGLFKFYSNLWKYAAIEDVYKIIVANTIIFAAIYGYYCYFLSGIIYIELPKRMLIVGWIISIILFVFSRSGYRFVKRIFINIEHFFDRKSGRKRVLVVGAGYSGYNVVRSIINGEKGYEDRMAVIVVDDDYSKNNSNLMGIRVTYDTANIPRLCTEYEIEEIIVAIPSATNAQINRIMGYCTQTDCVLKMIPPMSDISDGGFQRLRAVNITDLLFRDEVSIDIRSISEYIMDRVVLVTGGGGSIGSELCRQIVKFEPKLLIIFDVYENNAYELYNELKDKYGNKAKMIIRVGTIRDINCVERVFEEYRPNVVFHAAAHKHVPLMEFVPAEAVKNNVFGTLNVAKCADRYGVDHFVLLSTDKAVNPTNVMGATKRITELIIQEFASHSNTKFVAVRFGNVLGSNGSVIPLFQKQIKSGGPVTVTHKDITRFFMTIPEASRLVMQAASLDNSGRIYVLDMGKPVKIDDLARNLIRLSGFVPDKDIKIEYTGLRPGEKLYEELIMAEEKDSMKLVFGNKIFVTAPVEMDYDEFNKNLDELYRAAFEEPDKVKDYIKKIVPNFNPNGE
ncbi:MAG: nucleoside-diphosphate sugar epimerase/dehydratase [Clostridia bacterium]|nr:nucleoside-diphosphate sugar epimerase/dehydratase [Clostridia bacterium]